MKQWHDILQNVLYNGINRPGRMGIATRSIFGLQLEFNTSDMFPAVTTKNLAYKQMSGELECFLRGDTNIEQFHASGCTVWDSNLHAHPWNNKHGNGSLGRIYGAQWRNFGGVDQLQLMVDGMIADPFSRRHIVTAMNPPELSDMCLPPCHVFFQCYVNQDGTFDMLVYMRSVDLFLGLPFDIASFALLQILIANDTGLSASRLLFSLGDAHIYSNHIDQVKTVLTRSPLEPPTLLVDTNASINNFTTSMASMLDYRSLGTVPATLNT